VLLLEDVPTDAQLTVRALEQGGINVSATVVDSRAAFVEQLAGSLPDVILSDFSLPAFGGEQALQIARTTAPTVPFIFVTGVLGDEKAVELLKLGATDYVTKEHLARLVPAVQRALKDISDSRDRAELVRRDKAAADTLRKRDEHFRALVQNSTDIILTVDEATTILYSSPAIMDILGVDPDDAIGRSLLDLVHSDDRESALATLRDTRRRQGPSAGKDFRVRRSDGTYAVIELVASDLPDDNSVRKVVLNARDVTERRRAERIRQCEARLLDDIAGGASLEHSVKEIARAMEEHVPDWPCLVVLYDEPVPVIATGDRMLGRAAHDIARLAGAALRCAWPDKDVANGPVTGDLGPGIAGLTVEIPRAGQVPQAFWGIAVRGSTRSQPLGAVVFLSETAPQPTARDVEVARLGARLAAISFERWTAQAQLVHTACHDALTDMPNRTLLLDRARQVLARSSRAGSPTALLMIDLDHFKNINDSLGHSAGDQVLVEVANRLRSTVRPYDTVARLGGDEFVVLCDGLPGEAEVIRYAHRVLASLRLPINIDGHETHVAASIGIAMSADSVTPEALVRDADAAMYRAKENGRARVEIFDIEMRRRAAARMATEGRLHQAVEQELIQPHYQPIVDLGSQRVVGAEALARWSDATIGTVPPDVFVPIAEDSGLIVPLGIQILTSACRTAACWPGTLALSVNLSACQVRDRDLSSTIEGVLRTTNFSPDRLLLEITESTLMQSGTAETETLKRLNDLGVRLAVDDFGTGYNSLARLKQFPTAQLKIDRSFVIGLPESADDLAIVAAVIMMGHSLGLELLAEGIETEAQLAALQSLGCDLGQGYYFSRALSETELSEHLRSSDLAGPRAR
jgi:diguanylate cyclase (GGDEF)-like protein/PAS domain S-box-containing protein